MQVDLGGELSTAALAAATGLSPSRFHEVFRRATGETVKQYTLRLRLERAAFRLLTERTGVAAIGFDLGFGSHEVFTRAFRRVHGMAPTQFRRQMVPLSQLQVGAATPPLTPSMACLSSTTPVLLQPAHLAFVRRVGPYAEVEPAEFATLLAWVSRHELHPICPVGVIHDAPGITPAEHLRFDVAVQVSRAFRSSREVAYQLLPQRWCAATAYVGPFAGLSQAYEAAYGGASGLHGFQVIGLPVEEQYLTSSLLTQEEIQTTRILIPLRRTVP
jgi:AraC family transcriptional regulator